MDSSSAVSLTARIEKLRRRLLLSFSLSTALTSLLFAAWIWVSAPPPETDPAYVPLLLVQTVLATLSTALTLVGRRPWGARVLALSLLVIPTVLVLGFGMPHEPALAAYVGVLMVTSFGASQTEVLLATVIVIPLALLTYSVSHHASPPPDVLLSLAGLLGASGLALSRVGDSLVSAIHKLETSEAHFQRLSHVDPLTGLANRRAFDDALTGWLEAASESRPVGLVVIDVDNLKQINDRFGHPAGDQALQCVAESIRRAIRASDLAARIGGDEFAVLLPAGDTTSPHIVARRIQTMVETFSLKNEPRIPITISIGAAHAALPSISPQTLLAAADAELYSGRAHVRRPVPEA